MLTTLKDLLEKAEAGKYAVGAFNVPSLEGVMAVLSAAEDLKQPVIIQFAQVHESIVPLNVIGPVMVREAEKASVPVCVHLDHGQDLLYLEQALDLGFTSIMLDGSKYPFEENVRRTREAASLAHKRGASLEGEIGVMATQDNGKGDASGNNIYTDPKMAGEFAAATEVDALACSFGTVHGMYLSTPKLDFPRISEIRKEIHKLPIVMHGGSGVSPEDYRKVISRGVRKINYYTYMALAGGEGARKIYEENSKDVLFHDVMGAVISAMKADVTKTIKVFSEPEPKIIE